MSQHGGERTARSGAPNVEENLLSPDALLLERDSTVSGWVRVANKTTGTNSRRDLQAWGARFFTMARTIGPICFGVESQKMKRDEFIANTDTGE